MNRPITHGAARFLALSVAASSCASFSAPPPSPPDASAHLDDSTLDAAQLDDAQIGTVATSISNGQVARARLAMDRGTDARIRRFAADLYADPPGARIVTMDLGPRSSSLEIAITRRTVDTVRDLERRHGADFDRELIASEQATLAEDVRVLDRALVPKAIDERLARTLAQLRVALVDLSRQVGVMSSELHGEP